MKPLECEHHGSISIRKLSLKLNNSIFSLMQVCSFSKLVRMVSVTLSFQISSNLVGFVVSCRKYAKKGISKCVHFSIFKSAFSNWSYNRFKFEVTIRVWGVVRCAQVTVATLAFTGVSSIRSCFSQVSVLVNRHRAGIALISPTHLYVLFKSMLATYSIKLSVKGINSSGHHKMESTAIIM